MAQICHDYYAETNSVVAHCAFSVGMGNKSEESIQV